MTTTSFFASPYDPPGFSGAKLHYWSWLRDGESMDYFTTELRRRTSSLQNPLAPLLFFNQYAANAEVCE
jgi:hypothetical protein